MTFQEFNALAHEVFEEIPPEFKAGVDGLDVLRKTVLHPTLPEVYTLGECLSESYPSEFGGAGEVRSRVALYYGSFLALSRMRDDWDWADEVYETVTHEVRHHLESLASDDALEQMDYAEDQNFARREGESFEPFFYRSGDDLGQGTFAVDGDVFVERDLGPREVAPGAIVVFEWEGQTMRVRVPDALADVHFLRIGEVRLEGDGELYLVLVRRRGLFDSLVALLGGGRIGVEESDAELEATG